MVEQPLGDLQDLRACVKTREAGFWHCTMTVEQRLTKKSMVCAFAYLFTYTFRFRERSCYAVKKKSTPLGSPSVTLQQAGDRSGGHGPPPPYLCRQVVSRRYLPFPDYTLRHQAPRSFHSPACCSTEVVRSHIAIRDSRNEDITSRYYVVTTCTGCQSPC